MYANIFQINQILVVYICIEELNSENIVVNMKNIES